jgi:hypothetical protein
MYRIALGIILSVFLPASQGFAQTNAYIIDTVAGDYPLGDGGPATEALLEYPRGAVPDAAGRLFIADSDNRRIRKVAPDGVISTVVNDVVANDVTVDPLGNLYLAVSDQVFKATPQGDLTVIAGTGRSGYTGDGSEVPGDRRSGDWSGRQHLCG